MSILLAIFLGLIQGLTEFLPVSSSGHLSIFQNLFGLNYAEEEHLLFDVLLHIATLVSVCIVYRKELYAMIHDTLEVLLGHTEAVSEDGRLKPTVRNVLLLIVATLPLVLIVFVHDKVEELYYHTGFIAFALIVTGTLLFVSTFFTEGRKTEKTATVLDALCIGLGQAFATLPGLSRSGTTITVALSRGYKRSYAVSFSFLMSIPAVLGSALLSLVSAVKDGVDMSSIPAYLIGMLVAGVVGYFALTVFKKIVEKYPLTYFAYYCWAVGVVAAIATFIRG